VRDVVDTARRKIVNDVHLIAPLDVRIREV